MKFPKRCRRAPSWVWVVLAAMWLTGCSSSDEVKEGMIGYVEGFLGGVVADEPRAALIGRDVLSAGGTAADAAVATYFALSVTMPSSASLGGGGVCLVHDGRESIRKKIRRRLGSDTETTKVLSFLPRGPAVIRPGATRPTAIPGNARGFFALHSKYGYLRWSRLVAPAEKLARFGFQVSRVMAREIAAAGPALMEDMEARRIFGGKDGRGVTERDFIVQIDLSAVLGILRAKGPGPFYSGNLARQVVEATNAAGGSLTTEEIRASSPVWSDTLKVPFGNRIAHFPGPPVVAGPVGAQVWRMLADGDRFEDATETGRAHLLAESAMRALADRGRWMRPDGSDSVPAEALAGEERVEALMQSFKAATHTPAADLTPRPSAWVENPAATGFVVVDSEGSAVACMVTANNLFGTGRIARGTGIVLAAAPDKGGHGYTALSPMLAINHKVNQFYFGAAASGGVRAPTALASVAAGAMLGGASLEDALRARRVHHGGEPDVLYYEQGLSADIIQGLRQREYRVEATPVLGLVNAIYCAEGIPDNPKTCEVRVDPRGFGLAAASAGKE